MTRMAIRGRVGLRLWRGGGCMVFCLTFSFWGGNMLLEADILRRPGLKDTLLSASRSFSLYQQSWFWGRMNLLWWPFAAEVHAEEYLPSQVDGVGASLAGGSRGNLINDVFLLL